MKTKSIMLLSVFFLLNCAGAKFQHHPEFVKFFDEYDVDGAFLLYDLKSKKYISYNYTRTSQRYTPCSTFKIFNSLVGLETGVISGLDFKLKWDGEERWLKSWNKDHTLDTAFRNSVVWYYQEVAERIGSDRMQYHINKAGYGNGDITGGQKQFWLESSLKISQQEQVDLLVKLYNNDLPFSNRSMNIVKEIMVVEQNEKYTLRGKTGWGGSNPLNIGWFVGYLETGENVYFFATNIEKENPDTQKFNESRLSISKNILKELGLIN